MKTLFKLIAWLVGIIIVLVVVAAIAIPLFFNPNDYKPQIANLVKEHTGRDLNIEGDINLSFFPWLGAEIGKVELANIEGATEPNFASVERVDVRASVPALIKGQIGVDTVTLHGLQLNLSRDSNGKGNWEDLAALGSQDEQSAPSSESDSSSSSTLQDFTIGGIDLKDARIDWRDEQAGQHMTVDNLAVQTSAITLGNPINLEASFDLQGEQPPLAGNVVLNSEN